MSKEINQALMQNAVNNFTKVTRALHGDYAYSSGYYESSLLMLFAELPAQKQEMYLSMMQRGLQQKTLELADENVKKQVSLAVA